MDKHEERRPLKPSWYQENREHWNAYMRKYRQAHKPTEEQRLQKAIDLIQSKGYQIATVPDESEVGE